MFLKHFKMLFWKNVRFLVFVVDFCNKDGEYRQRLGLKKVSLVPSGRQETILRGLQYILDLKRHLNHYKRRLCVYYNDFCTQKLLQFLNLNMNSISNGQKCLIQECFRSTDNNKKSEKGKSLFRVDNNNRIISCDFFVFLHFFCHNQYNFPLRILL